MLWYFGDWTVCIKNIVHPNYSSTLRRGLAEAATKFAEPGLTKATRYEKGRRTHDERANVLRGWRNGKPFRRPCRAVAADTFSGRISPTG